MDSPLKRKLNKYECLSHLKSGFVYWKECLHCDIALFECFFWREVKEERNISQRQKKKMFCGWLTNLELKILYRYFTVYFNSCCSWIKWQKDYPANIFQEIKQWFSWPLASDPETFHKRTYRVFFYDSWIISNGTREIKVFDENIQWNILARIQSSGHTCLAYPIYFPAWYL